MFDDKDVRKKAQNADIDKEKTTEPEKLVGSIYDAGIIGTVHDSIDLSDFTPSPFYHPNQE